MRLDRSERKVSSFFIDLEFKCGPQGSQTYFHSLEHRGIRLRGDGRFSKRGFSGLPLKLPAGTKGSGQYVVRGRIRPKRAHGTYRAVGTLTFPDKTKIQCDTGTVRWKARRG